MLKKQVLCVMQEESGHAGQKKSKNLCSSQRGMLETKVLADATYSSRPYPDECSASANTVASKYDESARR